ncbi:DUF3667 domain-containing protein [Chitinophaga sp. HK235]|uniref:DUF3667 domain-containing protein n=1 Tax=Chitinophaga sp. HK235 TaxID=2952571 RepID=UPI0020117EE1|nr:DUF3667 domain-containing protein [Chitinophaga sp. HK235]
MHEIQHILHFEKGILYTIKALLLRPGQNIRAFVSEDRSRLVKPIIFIIVTSLIYTSITHFFHIEGNHGGPAHSATTAIMSWIESHYGYSNIIMGIFIGFWLKLMCRKSGYNFFEILIMLCFVMGTGMLLFAVFALVEGITGTNLILLATAVVLIYCSWAIGQFLGGKKFASYLYAMIAYLLGMISFTASAILLGFLIDSFNKA